MPVITPGDRDYLGDPSILKDISKKNFIRENIKHLKQLEKKNRRAKKKSESENEIPSVEFKRSLGRSKSQVKLGRRRLLESKSSKSLVKSAPKSPTTQVQLFKASSSRITRSSRTKKKPHRIQVQTDLDASSSSGNEVTKRVYQAAKPGRGDRKESSLQSLTECQELKEASFSPFNLEDIKREMKSVQDVNYVKLNQLVQYKPKNNTLRRKSDPTKAPPTYRRGVLPKYLREQKKDVESMDDKVELPKEREQVNPMMYQNIVSSNQSVERQGQVNKKVKVTSPTSQPPPGHILISDSERKQQLNEMRKHYAELITRLNRVPVHADTQKARQMKTELESELENLEAAISLFSKDKLFVKIT